MAHTDPFRILALKELGDRICIMGPSNSGKSTLANAIAGRINAEAIHLDVLHHLPRTDWTPRPYGEFHKLHDSAIMTPRWVMEGNYSTLLPQRLARATGFVLLDVSTSTSLYRYIRRCLSSCERIGALEGGRDTVKWNMLRHIAVDTPKSRKRYAKMLKTITIPKVYLRTPRQIEACYTEWELSLNRVTTP